MNDMNDIPNDINTLTLVVVSPDYYSIGLASPGMMGQPHESDDERTFFARGGSEVGSNWRALILPASDPRSLGMWGTTHDGVEDARAWNVNADLYLTPATPTPATPVEECPRHPTLDDLRSGAIIANEGLVTSTQWVVDEDVASDGPDGRLLLSAFAVDSDGPITTRQRGASVAHTLNGMVLVSDDDAHRGALRYARTLRTAASSEAPQEAPEASEEALPRTYTQEEYDAAIRAVTREARIAAEMEFDRWKEQTTTLAHDFANENSLCSEFDRFMEEVGLRPREREYSVRVEVLATGYTYVTVSASSEERACEIVNDDPSSWVSVGDVYDWASVEYDAEEAGCA